MRKRPISLTKSTLIVRYGLRAAFTLPLANIESIKHLPTQHKPSEHSGRNQSLKVDLNYSDDGNPNLLITLHRPIGKVSFITVGIERPDALINQITLAIKPTHNQVAS